MIDLPVAHLVDLPHWIHGALRVDDDGYPIIFINAHLSDDGQREAYAHELRHFLRGDLDSDGDLRMMEARADDAQEA